MGQAAPYPRLRARPVATLPVAEMVRGQTVEEAAALLPRLFNLCRVAQGLAARAAFGLPLDPDWQNDLRAEIVREHVMKLCLKWPAALNRPGVPLAPEWQAGSEAAREALFGPRGEMPRSAEELHPFLESGTGIGPLLCAISQLFAPGEACRGKLPCAGLETFFAHAVPENSVAARQASHPVLRHVEETWGRGPLWSALGVAYDLQALWAGSLPRAQLTPGTSVVPAARGLYAIRAKVEAGRVTGFARTTPTDHLLCAGGALEQSLARLPVRRNGALGPVLLSILDPCHPVTLEAVPEKEVAHA